MLLFTNTLFCLPSSNAYVAQSTVVPSNSQAALPTATQISAAAYPTQPTINYAPTTSALDVRISNKIASKVTADWNVYILGCSENNLDVNSKVDFSINLNTGKKYGTFAESGNSNAQAPFYRLNVPYHANNVYFLAMNKATNEICVAQNSPTSQAYHDYVLFSSCQDMMKTPEENSSLESQLSTLLSTNKYKVSQLP